MISAESDMVTGIAVAEPLVPEAIPIAVVPFTVPPLMAIDIPPLMKMALPLLSSVVFSTLPPVMVRTELFVKKTVPLELLVFLDVIFAESDMKSLPVAVALVPCIPMAVTPALEIVPPLILIVPLLVLVIVRVVLPEIVPPVIVIVPVPAWLITLAPVAVNDPPLIVIAVAPPV